VKRDETVATAAQIACQLEVSADKPGNVSFGKPFSDVAAEQFLVSSAAVGHVFARVSALGVGELVLESVRETRRLVGCNTNLGILLLLAPLGRAAARGRYRDIRDILKEELDSLTSEDAGNVYEAIRIASPGGLGDASRYDVNASRAPGSLMEAMRESSERDIVARQYVTCFDAVFEMGLPAFDSSVDRGMSSRDAVTQTFLTLLSLFPDTLIARKRCIADAEDVSARAGAAVAAGGAATAQGRSLILDLDTLLRDEANSLNPGATADITVVVLFLVVLRAMEKQQLPELLARW